MTQTTGGAPGLRVGSFDLNLGLRTEFGYDDNVRQDNKNSATNVRGNSQSTFVALTPSVSLVSNWDVHELTASARSTSTWFFDESSEDRTNAQVNVGGRLDVSRIFTVRAEGGFARLNEPRGEPESTGLQDEPTKFNRYGGTVSGTLKPNRWALTVGGSANKSDYEDGTTIGLGTNINNDDRDHTDYSYFVELAYDVISDGSVATFIRGTRYMRDYRARVDDGGNNRDSDGFSGEVGMRFAITSVLDGDVAVGYRREEYDNNDADATDDFGDTSTVIVNAGLTWYADPLWTVRLRANHGLRATTLVDRSTGVRQSAGIDVTWDPRDNLQFVFSGTYVDTDYEGFGGTGSREDNDIIFGVQGRYSLNDYVALNAGYQFRNRNSDAVAEDFTNNIFRVGVTLRR